MVINEVEQNPSGNDNYGSVYEWVELYNKGSSAADISGWTLTATGGTPVTKTIAQGTVLQPGQRKIIQSGSQWLDNSGERVVLKDDQGTIKDQTPTLNDARARANMSTSRPYFSFAIFFCFENYILYDCINTLG